VTDVAKYKRGYALCSHSRPAHRLQLTSPEAPLIIIIARHD